MFSEPADAFALRSLPPETVALRPVEVQSSLAGLKASFVLLGEDPQLSFPTGGVLKPLLRESGVSLDAARP